MKRWWPLVLGLTVGAALLALAPMAAILPKGAGYDVTLAPPIFDHAKVALIDEMIRAGVPPTNPFFAELGTTDHVAYYYLWHFSAAAAALTAGVGGWEADAALTWFTAYSSLLLMMGIAIGLSRPRWTAGIVLLVAATASLRLPLDWLIGPDAASGMVGSGSGFGGWLFQTSWAPQHVASAACVSLAALLIPRLASGRALAACIVLGLVAAAGFQSSVWVGGAVLAIASAGLAVDGLRKLDAARTRLFLGQLALAAVIAGVLCAPLLRDQFAVAALRGDGFPIAIRHVDVLGDDVAPGLRAVLDWPLFWLVYLPLELPAYCLAGGIAIVTLARCHAKDDGGTLRPLAILLAASLMIAWLLASTVGSNNDLGWRAILPAVFLLAAFAAGGCSHWLDTRSAIAAAFALAALGLGLPEGLAIIADNAGAHPTRSAQAFAASPALWKAVREKMAPHERLANNPLFLADMTPWPINISWALLADRRSCFAGADLALPFAPVSRARRAELEGQFTRVFAGTPTGDDLAQMANRSLCDVVVVVPQDGAWASDPFASSPYYRLVEARPDAWRIYRKSGGDAKDGVNPQSR
jgi:hypothetical protein